MGELVLAATVAAAVAQPIPAPIPLMQTAAPAPTPAKGRGVSPAEWTYIVTAAADWSVRLSSGDRRSIRAARTACTVTGTWSVRRGRTSW